MGVSGSGKTTVGQQLSEDLGWSYFDGDDFHSIKSIAKMSNGIPITDEDRSVWLSQIRQQLTEWIKTKKNAVISCSALKQQYRQQLLIDSDIIKFVYLKGSKELINRRLQSRVGHFMKADLLASQLNVLEEPDNIPTFDIANSPQQISIQIQNQLGLSAK